MPGCHQSFPGNAYAQLGNVSANAWAQFGHGSGHFWAQFENNLAMHEHDSGQSLATPGHHSGISVAMPERNSAMSRRYSGIYFAMLGRFSGAYLVMPGRSSGTPLAKAPVQDGVSRQRLGTFWDVTCHAWARSVNCCKAVLSSQRCPGWCLRMISDIRDSRMLVVLQNNAQCPPNTLPE